MRTLIFTLRFYGIQFIMGLICISAGLYGANTYVPPPSNSPFAAPDYGSIFWAIAAMGVGFMVYALKKGASEKMY